MINEEERVLIALSGGADSYALLELMSASMVFVPHFSIVVAHIDMGFDDSFANYNQIENYLKDKPYTQILEKSDIGLLAHSDYNRKKSPCFLCSRMRRKRLFEIADEHGCKKIALAHHRDDIIETLLINMFYGREIATMMPNQSLFSGRLHIIRPFVYLKEELIKRFAAEHVFPVMENPCPTAKTSRRGYIKKLLQELELENNDIRDNIFKSLYHVKDEYLRFNPNPLPEGEGIVISWETIIGR